MTKGRNLDEKDLKKISGGGSISDSQNQGSKSGGSGQLRVPHADDEPEP